MLLLCPLPLLLALAFGAALQETPGPPLPASEGEPGQLWETLELPAGFSLDLHSGVVLSRPQGASPVLTYAAGWLGSASPLRLVPSGSTHGATRFSRDGGEAIAGVSPVPGQELIFDGLEGGWGLVRVLEQSPQSLTLEFVLESDPNERVLERLPANLRSHSGPAGTRLQWSADPALLYLVERRQLAGGLGQSHSAWEELGRVAGGEFLDDELQLARVSEYRVRLLARGKRFGASARGVPGIERPEVRARISPGAELNLFSAIDDGLRADLTVESIRANGVQVYPGPGVLARSLSAQESEHWRIDPISAPGLRRQHLFIAPGGVLALRLPEGIYCLLRVENIAEQSVSFTRQFDLQGERLFAPIPELPEAHWQAGRGVVFRFEPSPRSSTLGQALLVVERERTLNGGDWDRCASGQCGQLELVHECDGSELLLRYRFRQGLDLERLSLATEPITVLVGTENDESRAQLLERAILDLGAQDFARRERSRAVLIALGEGAWPLLREALHSDNAELAASARELLVSGLREAGAEQELIRGGFARLLLSIGAEGLGLGPPPHPDWISRSPGVRALAVLRGLGWRSSTPGEIAGWRQVLTQEDPDLGVRLAAGVAASLAPHGPDLGFSFEGREARTVSPEIWPYGIDRGPLEALRDPWTALVEGQARQALATARHGSGEQQDLAEKDLVLTRLLCERYLERGEELFLDSALRLIEDPFARLAGALRLASERRQARQLPQPFKLRSLRLEAPETRLLEEELKRAAGASGGLLEIVLPAGIYAPPAGGMALAVDGAEILLRADGEVELDFGFTFLKGSRVTLSGLKIAPRRGIAINVMHSQLLLRGCRVEGGSLGLLGSDAVIELENSTVVAPAVAGLGAGGIRMGGRSLLLARGSRIECPATAIAGARAVLLDRCVVSSTQRNAIEGGANSDLWALASLIGAAKSPYVRLTRGVLEGVALVGDLETSLGGRWGVRACSEHLRCDAEQADFHGELWLDACSLRR